RGINRGQKSFEGGVIYNNLIFIVPINRLGQHWQFLCFSFLVGRFKPLNLQSAVQLAHEDVSSGSRMNR
ncbi:MAG: hypothetical protein EGP87_14050, partial [Paraprevotella clara]|nr:hypothetical protein [Paraprevotella clara]